MMDRDLIEEVFEVQEYAFDAARLREALQLKLSEEGVETRLNCSATVNRTGVRIGRASSKIGRRPNAVRGSGFQLHIRKHQHAVATIEFAATRFPA